MKLLLFLALLLYDIVLGSRDLYRDYDDLELKRRVPGEEKWRTALPRGDLQMLNSKKNTMKGHDNIDLARHMDDSDRNMDRLYDPSALYRRKKHYHDMEADLLRSNEAYYEKDELARRPPPFVSMERELDKRRPLSASCDREHERFEACFAGCAAVSCDNPRERLRPCYPFCEPGCVCAAPYVRDDRTHKCVLPEECTKGLKGIPDLSETD